MTLPDSLVTAAWAEVETAEAAVLPRFECGVYTQRLVIDTPIVAGPMPEHADLATATIIECHYEDIPPEPWWRFA